MPGSSHAEAALAGRGDVGILGNVGVVQQGFSSKGQELGLDSRALNLVRGGRAEKGGCGTNEDGKEDAGNNFLHDFKMLMIKYECSFSWVEKKQIQKI